MALAGERTDRPKSGEQLARLFSKTIKELTGLYFYPHLVRHFGAKVYLNENPTALETVRRVLAHKSIATTSKAYVSFEDDAAVRMYDDLILHMRKSVKGDVGND